MIAFDVRPRLGKKAPLSREAERELAVAAKAGDKKARDTLITSNVGLVWTIAKAFKKYAIPTEDLVSAGCVGLLESVSHYDPGLGNKFISYAGWWVRARMYELVKEMRGVVPVASSGAAGTAFFRLRGIRARREMQSEDASDEAIANELGITLDILQSVAFWVEHPPLSLESPVGYDGATLGEFLRDTGNSPEDIAIVRDEEEQRDLAIRRALWSLPLRERRIIERCVLSEEPESCQAVALELGLSRERVRQLKEVGLRRMQDLLKDQDRER
jgi:RNA polymerase sigma factor (sigma-70 family)